MKAKTKPFVTICKEFDFDAAHHLPMMPEGHKCRREHGHTYRVALSFSGEVGADGILMDYADIAKGWAPLHDLLDHRNLNNIPGLENPSTEVLVHWILTKWQEMHINSALWTCLRNVRVYESSTTYCEAGPIHMVTMEG